MAAGDPVWMPAASNDTSGLMKRPFVLAEPAPWFHAQALDGNPRYAFDTVAGRWILMLFIGNAGGPGGAEALGLVSQHRHLFDDQRACFFGVTIDPSDAAEGRIAQSLPGIRWFLDYDCSVSASYGAQKGEDAYSPFWLVLDPMLRVRAQAPLAAGPEIFAQLQRAAGLPYSIPAPVLVVPDVLPPDMCRRLIDLYDSRGGDESGFMREIDGVTRTVLDHSHKRRSDCTILDEQLIGVLKARLYHVLRPMIQRAFQFDPNRVERWIVARYDAGEGGYFRPHRDNTTKGTAHRKFAVTINLDTSSYEGGDLCFPEFGAQTYRAPTGGAVVFSCSLLHEARPVTSGKRYAFLPFLYDDEGADLRERNLAFVEPELRNYRSGLAQPDSA
jgi:peroxiredoxin